MPEPLSVDDFITNTLQDIRHPSSSDFLSKVSSLRFTVQYMDEGVENDRSVLMKAKKLVKSIISSGIGYADSVIAFCDFLEKLGQVALEGDELNGTDMAASLCKFSVIHRDLANMSKHLMQNLNSILVFPLETFMQSDAKADLKKPFEKSLREYEWKYDKLRKEKVQVMKETGIFTPEAFTAEMIEDLEKERRKLQLEACEYLIKVGELKAKRSVDLLQHLIDFYYAQNHCLRECLGVMEHFGKSMNELTVRVGLLQNSHDTQRRRLLDTREEIRLLLEKDSSQPGVTYAAPPSQPNRSYGTRKSGFLLKKSDGKVKRVWQKRKVRIGDGELCLYHADETKPPVRLALLTCQVKLPAESAGQQPEATDPSTAHPISELRNHFDLISNSRTYNFQAEDDQEFDEWINVLNNAMQEEFQRALNSDYSVSNLPNCLSDNRNNSNSNLTLEQDAYHGPSRSRLPPNSIHRMECGSVVGSISGDSLPGSEPYLLDHSSPTSFSQGSRLSRPSSADVLATDVTPLPNTSTSEHLTGKSLRHFIQSSLRSHPGNERCADCGQPDPEWVSVNLGVLICLECCGAHRELGVHCSRTQSLQMDELSTSQLLIPHFVGNRLFNEVFESSLASGIKPKPSDNVTEGSSVSLRRSFIKAKYVSRQYVTSTTRALRTDYTTSPSKGEQQRRPHDQDSLSERFLRRDLLRAIQRRNLAALLQVFAEGFPLMTPFHPEDDDDGIFGQLSGMTALHVAVECQSETGLSSSLPLIEFILQNSPFSHVQRTNSRGDTALHHATRCGSTDALKLLLQVGGLPTPMLHLRNNDGQTALQLGEDLLQKNSTSSSSLLADFVNCVELLKMAEHIADNSANSESLDALFSGGDSVDRSLTSRVSLQTSVDELSSVDWFNTHSSSTALHQSANYLRGSSLYTGSNELMGSRITSTARKLFGHFAKEPHKLSDNVCEQVDSCSNRLFPGNAVATLPRKKGRAPLPPPTDSRFASPMELEIPYESPRWAIQNARKAYFSSASKTTFTLLTSIGCPQQSASSTRISQSTIPASPSKVKEIALLLQTEGAPLTAASHSGSHVRLSKSGDERPKSVTSSSAKHPDAVDKNKQNCQRVYHSNEHIDVLLDVLEEKPLEESITASVSSGSVSVPPPPPVPPKPQLSSTALFSTLPPKSPSSGDTVGCLVSKETSLAVRAPAVDAKQSKPVLQCTPRLSKLSLPGHKKISRALSDSSGQNIHNEQSDASVQPDLPSELGTLFEALYDCEAGRADELAFRRGEIIQLTARSDDDWWEGCIQHEPWRRGLFPITYVKCASCQTHETA